MKGALNMYIACLSICGYDVFGCSPDFAFFNIWTNPYGDLTDLELLNCLSFLIILGINSVCEYRVTREKSYFSEQRKQFCSKIEIEIENVKERIISLLHSGIKSILDGNFEKSRLRRFEQIYLTKKGLIEAVLKEINDTLDSDKC